MPCEPHTVLGHVLTCGLHPNHGGGCRAQVSDGDVKAFVSWWRA